MRDTREQFQVESNVTGTSIAMGIDPDSMAHIMNVLTDLYSNKILAVIREYSTNAYDAHIEVGQTCPIEVTLPGALSPFLRIKDYGVGLTADDICEIYSQYGASTKRGSNAQNGMLGLGCKSALTYCSQFTVTSVKDATKIIVNIGRDDDGGGTMTVLDPVQTNEANGTEVTIPVGRYDIDKVISEADKFFRYWKPGTVLVDGKQPEQFKGLRLTDSLFIVDDAPQSLVVMGNVSYPAPQLNNLVNNANVVAFVPIGDVNFPPSRESLMDTRTTRTTIDRIRSEFDIAVKGAVQREIDAAETPYDALEQLVRWNKVLGGNKKQADYFYKGMKIPTTFRMPAWDGALREWEQPFEAKMLVSRVSEYNKSYSRLVDEIGAEAWPTTIWVENYAPEKFTAQHKRKLLEWCRLNELNINAYATSTKVDMFVMVREAFPRSPFIDESRIVAWEEIRKIKLETTRRTQSGVQRIPGSYDIFTEDGFEAGVPGDKLRQSYPIFYHKGNRWDTNHIVDAIKAYYDKYTVVCLALNRVAKFNRILPEAKYVKDAIKEKYEAWVASVTDDQKIALSMDHSIKAVLARMDAGKIDDPELCDAVRIAKIDVAKIEEARQTFQRYVVGATSLTVAWNNPLDRYFLFEIDSWRSSAEGTLKRNPDHIYTYFNAVYAANC